VFVELQRSIDHIWRAPAPARSSGLIDFIRKRVLTFGLVLGIGFLVAVSLLLHAFVAATRGWWNPMLSEWIRSLHLLNFVLDYVALTVLFAGIYKVLPSVPVAWRDVWIGALVTAVLFNVGNLLIGEYLGWAGHASAYGAGGSLALLLLWVYYSAQVFLFGAEFTWAYANEFGSRRENGEPAGPIREKRSPRQVRTPPS
jgi:membrane protein